MVGQRGGGGWFLDLGDFKILLMLHVTADKLILCFN